MPDLRCPACGVKGPVRLSEEVFEVRGQHPHNRLPVRRCRACGAWMTVRACGYVLPFLGFKAKEIDADLRRQMEHIWRREFGGTNPDKKIACPDCGHMFVTDSGMQQHRAAKHGSSAAS